MTHYKCDVTRCRYMAVWVRRGKHGDLYLCNTCLHVDARGWVKLHKRMDRRGLGLIHHYVWLAPAPKETWPEPHHNGHITQPVPVIWPAPEPLAQWIAR